MSFLGKRARGSQKDTEWNRKMLRLSGGVRRGPGPNRRVGREEANQRDALHQLWSSRASRLFYHFDLFQYNNNIWDGGFYRQGSGPQELRYMNWRAVSLDEVGHPITGTRGIQLPWAAGNLWPTNHVDPSAFIDYLVAPGDPLHGGLFRVPPGNEIVPVPAGGVLRPPPLPGSQRELELDILQRRGQWQNAQAVRDGLRDDVPINPEGFEGIIEAGWSFMGMREDKRQGRAWSCFGYALSDLFGNHINNGRQLMITLIDILEDILAVTGTDEDGNPYVPDGARCSVTFEGDSPGPAGEYANRFSINHPGSFRSIQDFINDPSPILEGLVRSLMFDSGGMGQMCFHRIFVNVITRLNRRVGGSLEEMPEAFKRLRESKAYKGMKKGYHAIEDSQQNSCGLDAIIMGLSNILARLKKNLDKVEGKLPKLCGRMHKFRLKLKKGTKKAKALFNELRFELATYIHWKPGNCCSADDLCNAFALFTVNHGIDAGLCIFDAIHPHKNIIVNYDRLKRVPQEKVCLVYWRYPDSDKGHYDCIDSTYVTSWMQKGTANRKNLRFSFKKLCITSMYERDDKGDFCENCLRYEKDMHTVNWKLGHKGNQTENKIKCSVCRVNFRSKDCFDNHKKAHHGLAMPACQKRGLCESCDKVHDSDYKCSEFYCAVCMDHFPKEDRKTHICYMKNTGPKVKHKMQKVIYSDMEGSRISLYHQAVCVASCWSQYCEEHLEEYKKSKCDRCKKDPDEWGLFCSECARESLDRNDCIHCTKVHTNMFRGEKCLQDYLHWLTTEHEGATVVFHNGGKYDLYLLNLELLATGNYFIEKEATRGTQILFMKAVCNEDEHKRNKRFIRFIDSCNFIQTSLRNFPKMFTIKSDKKDKGRFPYELLNKENWEDYNGKCPDPELFGVTDLERKNLEKVSKARKKEIEEILQYIEEFNKSGETWNAIEKLEEYTIQDCRVLYEGCEEFRKHFWESIGADPFHWVTLAAAVAGGFRQIDFMPENSIQIFGVHDREWQRQALRGGKCEAFKLYWKAENKNQQMKVVDVISEYPFCQAYRYYPIGAVTVDLQYNQPKHFYLVCQEFLEKTGVPLWEVLQDQEGKKGVGIIECEIESAESHIPVLPYKIKTKRYVKNMFMNRSGPWIGYMPVLACAILHHQVIIKSVTRLQYWKKVSDKLFKKFLCGLYASKAEASGWEGLLGKNCTEEEKKEFLEESAKRGVRIDPSRVKDNPGRRSTNKIANNCGWGYLCQKPNTDEVDYFNNEDDHEIDRMEKLLSGLETDENSRRLIGNPQEVGQFTRVRTTKKPEDVTPKEMNKKVAYHVGGLAPAYGLCLLSTALLALDPSQPAYCDTDSIMYVIDSENKDHRVVPTGNYMGDFKDEYPTARITEFVCCGLKSYFLKMEHPDGKIEYKGRFKGIPYMSASFSLLDSDDKIAQLGFEQMKEMVLNGVNEEELEKLTMTMHYTNFFKRGPDMKIRAVREKKTQRFTYDKRRVQCTTNPNEISTYAWCDDNSILTHEQVKQWWKELPKEVKKRKEKTHFIKLQE